MLSVTTLSHLVECRLPRDGLRIENNASKCFPWAQQFVNILYMGHMHPQAPNWDCQNRTSLTMSKQKSAGSAHWWKGLGMFPLSPSPKWPGAPGVPYELKNTLLSDLPWPPYQARHLVLFLLFQEWPSLVCCSIQSLSSIVTLSSWSPHYPWNGAQNYYLDTEVLPSVLRCYKHSHRADGSLILPVCVALHIPPAPHHTTLLIKASPVKILILIIRKKNLVSNNLRLPVLFLRH